MSRTAEIFRKRLRLAVIESIETIQDKAQTEHRYKIRSGALEKAVNQELAQGGMMGTVFLNANIARYGPFVHEGYGPHVIRPRHRTWLRWPVGGKDFAFARKVTHPGWAKDPFIYDAFENSRSTVHDIFEKQTAQALEEIENDITSQ